MSAKQIEAFILADKPGHLERSDEALRRYAGECGRTATPTLPAESVQKFGSAGEYDFWAGDEVPL